MSLHQQKQIEIINQIEKQIEDNSLQASMVVPVEDFDADSRICLTSVHFPSTLFIKRIYSQIIEPLKKLFPKAYYYGPPSLHLTIKNIRVINDPPHFTGNDVKTAKEIFKKIIPTHAQFSIYPYRLLLFKNNLTLISTTDEELDRVILHLNRELALAGIPDDKQYINSRYFFSNMTLARFNTPPPQFIEKMIRISSALRLTPYLVDSVSLVSGNAALKKLSIYGKWNLLN